MLQELGISMEDLTSLNQGGYMPLTNRAVDALKKRKDIVASIRLNTDTITGDIYPLNANTGWTRDNYGPVWIPKKGESVRLTMQNIAVYERPIRVYEGNDLQVRGGKIFINGKQTDQYTFKILGLRARRPHRGQAHLHMVEQRPRPRRLLRHTLEQAVQDGGRY